MVLRIFGSSLLAVSVALALWLFGETGAVFLLSFFAVCSQCELCRLMERFPSRPAIANLVFWTIVIMFGSWCLRPPCPGVGLTAIAAIFSTVCAVRKLQPRQLLSHLAPTLFALFYVPFTMQFGTMMLRDGGTVGLHLLGWSIAVSKLGDIGGLFVGSRCGSHPLAAAYSPKKTLEGFFGAIALATAGGFLLCLLANRHCRFPLSPFLATVLAAAAAVVGAVADLFESALKRQSGLKDSGKMIPGIGGCLDLCDSLFFTLPMLYVAMQFSCCFG
ncbi:MAG: phosphatidate cytidylyltransferase [Puniceicoccales bacterium]|jgi:phosphatidate cytidylyltransferase|nr:phosphatidate cytidylyltransferase [Puniceicoccales bacterium]